MEQEPKQTLLEKFIQAILTSLGVTLGLIFLFMIFLAIFIKFSLSH